MGHRHPFGFPFFYLTTHSLFENGPHDTVSDPGSKCPSASLSTVMRSRSSRHGSGHSVSRKAPSWCRSCYTPSHPLLHLYCIVSIERPLFTGAIYSRSLILHSRNLDLYTCACCVSTCFLGSALNVCYDLFRS